MEGGPPASVSVPLVLVGPRDCKPPQTCSCPLVSSLRAGCQLRAADPRAASLTLLGIWTSQVPSGHFSPQLGSLGM